MTSVENEQADAGRDGRTCLARPKAKAQTGTATKNIFPVQLTPSRIGNLTRLIYTQLQVMTVHARMHTTSIFLTPNHVSHQCLALYLSLHPLGLAGYSDSPDLLGSDFRTHLGKPCPPFCSFRYVGLGAFRFSFQRVLIFFKQNVVLEKL